MVGIDGASFLVNGRPTYKGRVFNGVKVEGLLLNARLVQGIFDDLNPETRKLWAYPDGTAFDAERNTREFVAAMGEWRRRGLVSFTINLEGGSPQGYSKEQPWHNSAFTETGELRAEYMGRLERILDRADELGMVVILGYFYFGQDQRLADEAAVGLRVLVVLVGADRHHLHAGNEIVRAGIQFLEKGKGAVELAAGQQGLGNDDALVGRAA